ncbi:MAG: hypothetical protein NT075_11530 [Chloroflexi bacterium]|nr:hypothetical protein [Chloroflexota bacterium]
MTVPRRFGVLRFIGTLLKVIAWIILILSILGAIGVGLASSQVGTIAQNNPFLSALFSTPAGGIVAGVVTLLFGLIYFLVLYASGESLHMQLAVEENTRLTAALLLRMHQESQQETRPTYASGFANEPFER